MRALLTHLPFEEHDTHRKYMLKVDIGGERLCHTVTVPAMEVRHNPHFIGSMKYELVRRVTDQLCHEIFEQIGIH